MAHGGSSGAAIPAGGSHGPGTQPGTDHLVNAHEGHPGARTYIKVATILAAITAVEVAIWYVESLEDVLVPMLLVLSAIKFVAVVGFFMHLKFDDRRFTWIFGSGLAVGATIVLSLMVLFNFHEVVLEAIRR